MTGAFDSSPVLPGGQADCINSVHDSFVVSDGSEMIFGCEFVGFYNFFSHDFSRSAFPLQFFDGDFEPAEGFSFLAVVGENGDSSFDSEFVDVLFEFLANSIDRIGPHGVASIDIDIY